MRWRVLIELVGTSDVAANKLTMVVEVVEGRQVPYSTIGVT